jgi:hypothetical protein
MPPRPSLSRPVLAAGTAALLALAATGCGSDDESSTTTAAGGGSATTTSTATTGGDAGGGSTASSGAPAANEDAIRAALAKSPAATTAAKTARITLKTSTAGIVTEATGTLDLAEQRYAFTQTLGDGGGSGQSQKFQNYGEKDKVYIKIPGSGGWNVTDNPAAAADPLAQVRQLEKATITKVGGTKEYGGKTCREFSAELGIADVVGQFDDPSYKRFLEQAPKGAKVPVTSCIDANGLAYASSSEYDLKDVLGDKIASALPSGSSRSSSELLITDYGTAPEPKRPAGIDDAKPLGTGTPAPAAG